MKNLLFDLIHSLSKAEKRYWRVYTKGNVATKNKNYLQLFDIILEDKVNDEKQIKKKLLTFNSKINYNFAKSYLKSEIIECLLTMHANTSVDSKLVQMISAAKLLRKKAFYQESNSLLKRAEKLATQAEQFGHLLEIYTLQSAGCSTQADIDTMEKKAHLCKQIDNLNAYYIVSTKIYLAGRKMDVARQQKEIKTLKKLLEESQIMNSERSALSLNAKIIFYHIKTVFHYFSGEYRSALIDLHKRLEYQETLPYYITEMPMSYNVCLSNIIAICIKLKNYVEAQLYLKKLSIFLTQINSTIDESFRRSLQYEENVYNLIININTGQVHQVRKILAKTVTESGVLRIHASESFRINFYYYAAYGFFLCEEYGKSIMLLNRANTETDLSKRDDMNSMVRILEIIDHYEMGEVELITYLERSVRRFIRQKNRMFKTERAILKFFRKDLLETEEKEERTVAFKKLKHTLKKLFEDPFEAKIAEYFDFNAWIESNIEGRSFAEMVKINNGN